MAYPLWTARADGQSPAATLHTTKRAQELVQTGRTKSWTGRAGPAGTRSSVAPPQPMLVLQSTQLPPLMSYVQSCPSVSECPEQQGFKRLCCQTVPCQALSHRNGRRSLFWSRVVPVTAAPSVPSDGQAKRRYFLIQQRGLHALQAVTSAHMEKHFKGVK